MLTTLPKDRYPKQLFNQKWNIKPRRGRQKKVWSWMVAFTDNLMQLIYRFPTITGADTGGGLWGL